VAPVQELRLATGLGASPARPLPRALATLLVLLARALGLPKRPKLL
jgi:hypothetical protein